jgi:two-component system response regulator DctR
MASAGPLIQVVDDEAPMRDALAWLLKAHYFASRLHESAEAFLSYLRSAPPERGSPGCIVLDIRMPGIPGDELHARLAQERLCDEWPVLFLTGHGDIEMAVDALKAGAFDFVEKPFNDESFVTRVRAAVAESERRLRRSSDVASLEQRQSTLTPREREVMELVLAGHYNKVIADRLGIVPRTVEFFRARIFEKMGVRSAVELASLVARHRGDDR